jgi:thymidylate synthase
LPVEKQVVGRIYGAQWRAWTSEHGQVDQVERLVRSLQQDPYSRRHLLTTYNPAELEEMCLPPCHLLAQFNVRTTKHLDCVVTMRSVDLCLGLPSDIILYATLLLILCNETGYSPGKITFMMGDSHIYRNHIDQFQVHAQRTMHKLPKFKLKPAATIDNFVAADLELINYQHSGALKYEFAV